MQFFYASPVTFRQIVLAKNLTYAGVLGMNTLLAYGAVSYFYSPPRLAVSIATLAGLLFAAPLNFAAGNLLSETTGQSTTTAYAHPVTTSFAYDGLDRVTVATDENGFKTSTLYDGNGIAGALGVSGDSSCADHNVAWRVRHQLGLDRVPAGVSPNMKDAIIYDIGPDGKSPSGFGHPKCIGKEDQIATDLGAGVSGNVVR